MLKCIKMFYVANNTVRQLIQHRIQNAVIHCVIQTKFDFVFAISKTLSRLRTLLRNFHSFTFCLQNSNMLKKGKFAKVFSLAKSHSLMDVA